MDIEGMNYFSILPLELHIHIVKFLPLRDQLAYSELASIMYDAVYYVFAHVKTLDFTTVLGNERKMTLNGDKLLNIY